MSDNGRYDNLSDDELAELYCVAYLEAYESSREDSIEHRRREAREIAGQKFPKVKEAVADYSVFIRQGKTNQPDLLPLGNKVLHQLAALARSGKTRKARRVVVAANTTAPLEKTVKSSRERGISPHSFSTLYEEWIKNNEGVPPDPVIAYFAGVAVATVATVRLRLREKGYVMEFSDGYWRIRQRPAKEKTLEEMSKEELIVILRKLVA